MKSLRRFVDGPWRAVPVLGVTQILAWGSIFYTPVLIVPLIAAERGWSIAFTMGGFSFGLLVAGLVLPYVGRAVDHYGGHVVMTAGSLTGALGLLLIARVADPLAYFAVWLVLGVAMAASLYDSAFASLGRIFGAAARRPNGTGAPDDDASTARTIDRVRAPPRGRRVITYLDPGSPVRIPLRRPSMPWSSAPT